MRNSLVLWLTINIALGIVVASAHPELSAADRCHVSVDFRRDNVCHDGHQLAGLGLALQGQAIGCPLPLLVCIAAAASCLGRWA